MSSRARRRAQREREEQASRQQPLEDEDETSEPEIVGRKAKSATSAFDLLRQADDGDDENTDDLKYRQSGNDHTDDPEEAERTRDESKSPPAPTSKRKKKKKKKKGSKIGTVSTPQETSGIDDIDAALRELSMAAKSKEDQSGEHVIPGSCSQTDHALLQLLAVEPQHLHVRNEMRKLFGDISFDEPEEDRQQPRQSGDRVGLAEAVKGHNSVSGAGLPAVLRRRNPFIQASEDWPKASGGGLSMEVETTNSDGSTLFKFVHNKTYQSAQREFEASVQTMNPETMIYLLRFNPYHIGTLLQVSEIAKQEKDYATAGELIERALFSFGRALHPRFVAAMSQGKARLDFRRPENREFFLAACRYMRNIGMRATWRTAFEWAKLVLQLSPDEDCYSMMLCIDQLALRSRQTDTLLKLCERVEDLSDLPNLRFSQALAQYLESKTEADTSLKSAIAAFPWVAAHLLRASGVDKIPASIWGSEPPTELTRLRSELYVSEALDLWKTTEAILFLRTTAENINRKDCCHHAGNQEGTHNISMSEARHMLLLDKPPLIALLPSRLTSKFTSSSDPLPPEDDLKSYETGVSDGINLERTQVLPDELIGGDPQGFIELLSESNRLLEMLIPGIGARIDEADNNGNFHLDEEDVARALHRASIPPQRFAQVFNRLLIFRQALRSQPDRRVQGRDGSAAYFTEDGHLHIEPGRERASSHSSDDELPELEGD